MIPGEKKECKFKHAPNLVFMSHSQLLNLKSKLLNLKSKI